MLGGDGGSYYVAYALLCAALGVVHIKVKSTEGVTITTKEFKIFQTSFLSAYSLMMLAELLCLASFYPTLVYLGLPLEKITRLYVVTVVSTSVCSLLMEVVDVGARKDKCVLSAVLYGISMMSLFLSSGHFELLLLGRVIYGAASALHHSAFEAYAVHEHSTLGFPDDW